MNAALAAVEAEGRTLLLPVGDGHELFVETRGRSDRPAALFLHGGPGSGCQPMHHRLFAPGAWQAVFPDQRGAGRSRPHGERRANTTAHLVADLEAVRAALGLERWLVVGGSWGATLALAYAEAHPERVSGLVLRSVFLGTRAELDWAFVEAPARFRPELARALLDLLDTRERTAPLAACWRRILAGDGRAAWAWHDLERALSELAPAAAPGIDPDRPLPPTALMEAHYFSNDCFLAPGQLLRGAPRLNGIPGIVIAGRYDLLCPPGTAAALCARWPTAELRLLEATGHALSEPAMFAALAAAIAEFAAPGA